MNGSNNFRYTPCFPDLKWINREIPILEVAQRLGIPVHGIKTICTECGARRLTFRPSTSGGTGTATPGGRKKRPST